MVFVIIRSPGTMCQTVLPDIDRLVDRRQHCVIKLPLKRDQACTVSNRIKLRSDTAFMQCDR
jgi:hypothetical protein